MPVAIDRAGDKASAAQIAYGSSLQCLALGGIGEQHIDAFERGVADTLHREQESMVGLVCWWLLI